jgi:hypothetical protein
VFATVTIFKVHGNLCWCSIFNYAIQFPFYPQASLIFVNTDPSTNSGLLLRYMVGLNRYWGYTMLRSKLLDRLGVHGHYKPF